MMPLDGGPILSDTPDQKSQPDFDPACQSLNGSTESDSGYGSINTEDPRVTNSGSDQPSQAKLEEPETRLPIRAVPTPVTPSVSTVNTTRQQTFDGLTVFKPSPAQAQRYHEIIGCITQPLNNCFKKRGLLSIRPRPKRVDAVRLIVMGSDRDSAKPYIVFFCSPDVEKMIIDMLEKPAYQQIFQPRSLDEVPFCYKTVQSSLTLKLNGSRYSAEVAQNEKYKVPVCGAPIRLYRAYSEEWRRATLGGVIKVTTTPERDTYCAMTAGHFLDDWSDSDDDQTSDCEESNAEDQRGVDEIGVLETSETTCAELPTLETHGTASSPWDFEFSQKYEDLTFASKNYSVISNMPSSLCNFDWMLFKVDDNQLNYFPMTDSSGDRIITASQMFLGYPVPEQSVLISTASSGVIEGVLQVEMAKIVIGPGEEVVDAHIVSLGCKQIKDGDSGSWVISMATNNLIGHVVASDILGDVYVIPIHETFNDIRYRLKALAVSLPSISEPLSLLVLSGTFKSIQLLYNIVRPLYRRMRATNLQFEYGFDSIRGLHTSLKHLRFEVQDPDSLLNQQAPEPRTYIRQLTAIVEDGLSSLEQFTTLVDELEFNQSRIPKEFSEDEERHLLKVWDKLSRCCSKVNTIKISIDIFLDTVQLHNPYKARHVPSTINNEGQLDVLKSMVDNIALRLSYENKLHGENDEVSTLQQLSKEIAARGFSVEVLEEHKDVLRAYIRELDSSGFFDQASFSVEKNLAFNTWRSSTLASNDIQQWRSPDSTLPGYSSESCTSPDEGDEKYLGNASLVSTRRLMALDASTSRLYPTATPSRITPLPAQNPPLMKLKPDSQGKEIPLDAIWTKIHRRFVSPDVVEHFNLRYEARPGFIAILGVLSKADIVDLARRSAEARQARYREKAFASVPSLDLHSGTTTETESNVDLWDLDLQAWDSDLDEWGPRIQDSSDDELGMEAKLGRKLGTLGDSRAHKPNDPLTRRTSYVFSDRARDMDRERSYRDRYGNRSKGPGKTGDRHNARIRSKKKALGETLGAVGIGGAAASLLSVLTEAASGL